jgi:hypothetical protein
LPHHRFVREREFGDPTALEPERARQRRGRGLDRTFRDPEVLKALSVAERAELSGCRGLRKLEALPQ